MVDNGRRRFLQAAGGTVAGVLAGCMGGDTEYERTVKDDESIETVVDEGDWWEYPFEFDREGFIEYTVETEDHRAETFVLPYKDYENYVDRMDLDIFTDMNELGLNRHSSQYLHDSGDLEPGEYIFILDHTRRGETNPPDDSFLDSDEEANDRLHADIEIETGTYDPV